MTGGPARWKRSRSLRDFPFLGARVFVRRDGVALRLSEVSGTKSLAPPGPAGWGLIAAWDGTFGMGDGPALGSA